MSPKQEKGKYKWKLIYTFPFISLGQFVCPTPFSIYNTLLRSPPSFAFRSFFLAVTFLHSSTSPLASPLLCLPHCQAHVHLYWLYIDPFYLHFVCITSPVQLSLRIFLVSSFTVMRQCPYLTLFFCRLYFICWNNHSSKLIEASKILLIFVLNHRSITMHIVILLTPLFFSLELLVGVH